MINSLIMKGSLILCISILIHYIYSNRKDYYIKVMMTYCYAAILKFIGKLLSKVKFFEGMASLANELAYNLMSEYNDKHLTDSEMKGL